MSDTDVIRRALGQFKEDSDKQGDRAAIRNALDDTFYAAMDGIYRLPYPETKRLAPVKPTPKPTATSAAPKIPPRQAAPLPTATSTPGGNWFAQLTENLQASIKSSTQMLQQNPVADLPDWADSAGGALLGGLSTGLGVLGDVAGTVNKGADLLDEGMKRAVNHGQLPADYKPFSEELADAAGQWNERIAEPLAGVASKLIYDEGQGLPLMPGNQDYGAIVQDLAAGKWNEVLFGRPQAKEDNRAPANNAASAIAATTALTLLERGDIGGALNHALDAFGKYGNEEYDRLSPADKLAASLLFDPLNFIPGLGIGKANKAAKLDDLTRTAKFVEKAEDLLPHSWFKTEAAKLTEMVKTGLDNLFVKTDTIADADEFFNMHRRFIEVGKDAKAFDAVAKAMTGLDTIPAQRAGKLLQGFEPILDEVEQGFRAAQKAMAGVTVDAKTLPKVFSNFLDDIKAGKPLTDADLLDVTKAEMYTRTQSYMAEQASKLGKPRNLNAPANLATRFMNNLKAAEALVYIGLSPFTFVRNVVNGMTTMAIEGVNPLWDASAEISRLKKLGQAEKAATLQRAVTYQKGMMETGNVVRRAMGVGDAGTSQTGAFGSFMSRMIGKMGKANPLHWYQQIENGMRAQVWTQTYWHAVNHGWDVGKMLPPMDAATNAILHAYRVPDTEIYNLLKEAGLDEGKAVRAVRDYLRGKRGPALDYDKIAAEMGLTRQQLLSILDEADQAKAVQMAQEVSARVANGENQAQAANDVVARAAQETTQATANKLGLTEIGENGLPIKAKGIEDAQLESRIAELAQQEQDLGDELVRLQGSKTKVNKARRKEISELLDRIDEERTQLQEALGMTDEEILFGRNPTMPAPPKGAKVVTPEIKQAQPVSSSERALPNFKDVTPPLESELPPIDIPTQALSQQQQNARDYLLGIKRADGTPVYTAAQLATWKPETLERVAGELQTVRKTFDDIMLSAKNKGIATATEKGAPNNRHLINVLNKHKQPDAPRFLRMDDVVERADEATEILGRYVPSGSKSGTLESSNFVPKSVRDDSAVDISTVDNAVIGNPVGNSDVVRPSSAPQAIEKLRQVAQPDEAAETILSADEMIKAKARTQADLYEALLKLWSREDIRRVRVGTDAENKVFAWLRREVLPRMSEARQAATVAADWMDNAVMISRDGETKFDAALGLLSPFQFWRSRYALQSLRRVADRPARLAWYLKLREGQDQIQDDPRYPKRLQGRMFIPIPGIPAWAGGGMYFNPTENLTSIEQTFGVNKMQDEVTDAEVARAIRALAKRGEISLTEASNVIANQRGSLWDATKQQLTDLSKTTEGADSFSTMFRPHLPFDIGWKLLTGTPEEIGVLFPMTRLIRGATGINIEQPLKAGLRQLTGNQDIPDWDMWEQYRTDRALADMVGDGLITERDAMLALIERSGTHYEQAQQRAKAQTSMQNFSVFGGQLFPQGEREYYKAQQLQRQLLDEAVANLGGNPTDYSSAEKWDLVKANGLTKKGTPLGDFYTNNPVYGARQSVYDEAEKRLKDYLADEIWGTYNNKGALDKRLMTDDLGDDFRAKFLSPDTRDLEGLTLDTLGEWVRKVRGYVPQQDILQVGDFPEVRYAALSQNERYGAIQQQRDLLFDMDALGPKLDTYHGLAGDDKYAYRDTQPDMDAYLDWYASQMRSNPDISKLMNPDYQQSTGYYVNTRDASNDVTRYVVQNLENMVRRIAGRQGRGGGGGGGAPFLPGVTQPTGKPPVLSKKAKDALTQRMKNPQYFIPRDVYEELLAMFRASGARMSFQQWMQQMAMGGGM